MNYGWYALLVVLLFVMLTAASIFLIAAFTALCQVALRG